MKIFTENRVLNRDYLLDIFRHAKIKVNLILKIEFNWCVAVSVKAAQLFKTLWVRATRELRVKYQVADLKFLPKNNSPADRNINSEPFILSRIDFPNQFRTQKTKLFSIIFQELALSGEWSLHCARQKVKSRHTMRSKFCQLLML